MSDKPILRVIYWNADGVRSKQQELTDLAVSDLNTDVLAISETRLTARSKLDMKGFACYRKDKRCNGTGQGVAILVKADLMHSLITVPNTLNLEAIGISLKLPCGDIVIFSVYQSPNMPLLVSDIDVLMATGNRVLLMGDINAKHPYWSPGPPNVHGKRLYEHMLNSDYIIHYPQDPTLVHYRPELKPSTPDILLTKNFNTISDICTIPALSSNHLPVFASFTVSVVRKQFVQFNYSKADWNKYRSLINSNIVLSSRIYSTTKEIDSTLIDFQNTVISSRNASVPTLTVKSGKTSIPRRIKRLIQKKNQLRRWVASETVILVRKQLNHQVHKLQLEIDIALQSYSDKKWDAKLKKVDSPSAELWRVVKSLRSNSVPPIPSLKTIDGTVTTNLQEQCDTLADAFLDNMLLTHNWVSDEQPAIDCSLIALKTHPHDSLSLTPVRPREIQKCILNLKTRKAPGPDNISNLLIKNLPQKSIVLLTKIFNTCFTLNYFPSVWKTAKVIPIHKPGKDTTIPTSYRPISLLPCLGKLFEKIIYTRLTRFSENMLLDEQFGFRAGHSTAQQLARVAEAVVHNLNLKKSTGMVLLDIEKAFDTVWHKALLHKLITLNTPMSLVKIIQSYLTDRSFQVHINDYLSSLKPVPAGVPQGSILGPYLFLIYLNDIPKQTRTSIACFADDTASFTSSEDVDLITGRLQLSIELLLSYFTKWKLKINANKTEAILFTRQRSLPTRVLQIDGFKIPWSRSVKYLGLVLDNRLNWSENTDKLCLKGIKALNALSPVLNRRSCLSSQTKLNIYKTLVRPCITYACPVWSSTCTTNINKLQVIQNRALKYSFNTPLYTNLQKLHIEIGLPNIISYIYKLSKKFYIYSNPKNKNILIKNICITRKTDLTYIDKYNRYKLPHHLFLELDE